MDIKEQNLLISKIRKKIEIQKHKFDRKLIRHKDYVKYRRVRLDIIHKIKNGKVTNYSILTDLENIEKNEEKNENKYYFAPIIETDEWFIIVFDC